MTDWKRMCCGWYRLPGKTPADGWDILRMFGPLPWMLSRGDRYHGRYRTLAEAKAAAQ